MKGLFLVCEILQDFEGVSKKILEQRNAMERIGFDIVLSDLKSDEENKLVGRFIGTEAVDKYSNIDIISKIQSRIKYGNLYSYIVANRISFVYIRYVHFANPFFISFLKKLKKNGIKILLEIPTYPYDSEYKNPSFISKIVMRIEKGSRLRFRNLVTRILTVTPATFIFGVPAIEISNGIEVDSINIIEKREFNNEIHLIGVASIGFWHGYDRVIEGMRNYYEKQSIKKKVFFHIVGDNSQTESIRLRELVIKYNLADYVIFHGRKSGKELDIIFNKADIAVGSLGCHRISIQDIKSLKNREYCARGIPFFYSERDIDFENSDFVLKVPGNDNPINIEEINEFVINHKFDPLKIREYARKHLTWDKQFKKVFSAINPDLK
jgi:glycosyltransferase involved in cell wall biosynthesis